MKISISKKWFYRNAAAIVLTAIIAILVPVEKAYAKTGLVVVTLGLKDEANDDWVGIASNLGPAEDRWVIKQTGAPTYYRRLTHVPLDNVIAIPTNASRDQIQTLLARIAKAPDAVVVVNMDPGAAATSMGKAGGRISSRRWAARVVALLGQEHLALFPASQTTWIGHGEGTEPMAMVQDKAQGSRRHLFDRMVAMSPSVITEHYPRRTVMVVADGDAPFRRFKGSSNGAAAKVIASMGYRVVRIMDQALKAGFSSPARSALTAASCGALLGYGGASLMSSHSESYHSEVTQTQQAPGSGGQMVYYSPETAAPTEMKADSLGNALTTVTNNDSETNIVNNGPTTNINESTTNVDNENTTNVDNESTTNITNDNSIYNAPPEGPDDNPTDPGDVYQDPAPGDNDSQFGNFQPMTLTAPQIEPDGKGQDTGPDDTTDNNGKALDNADMSVPDDKVQDSGTDDATENGAATDNAEQPAATDNAEQPAATDNAEQPAATDNAEQPAATDNAEQPASTDNAEQPAATDNAEQPAATDNAEQPAATDNAEQPASTDNAEQPASTDNAEQPAATDNAEQPAATDNAEQPAATDNAEQPAATDNAEQPAATDNAEQPAATDNAEQPAATDNAEQPAATDNAEQPAAEQPAQEQPAEEQPAEEQPAQEQPAQEVPANSGPS